jgi:hypothetical protein
VAEDDPPVPVLIGGVDEALGLCCSGSQRLESAEVREWHKSLTWRGHSLRRKRASLTAELPQARVSSFRPDHPQISFRYFAEIPPIFR